MEHTVIGATGVVIVATRGPDGPGEVSLRIGGATESYLARSDEVIPRGAEIIVIDLRGPRTVEITTLDPPPDPAVPSDPLLEL